MKHRYKTKALARKPPKKRRPPQQQRNPRYSVGHNYNQTKP